MQYFKFLVLLLLLHWSNPATAFSSVERAERSLADTENSYDVSEGQHQLSESSLTASVSLPSAHLSYPTALANFYFFSNHREALCENYLATSREIDPSLGIAEIIFPFHCFL